MSDENPWDEFDQANPAPPEAEGPMDPSRVLNITPEQAGWDEQMHEAVWLLSLAVHRLGGSLVITAEERERRPHYTIAWDLAFTNRTGGIRIFSMLEEEGT